MELPSIQSSQSPNIKIEWSKEATMALISFWEQKECLYNCKCNLYHNKHARQEALDWLANKISEYIPNVTATIIKTKINYLRQQYGREVQKVNESCKSGSGTDEMYVPIVYWYDDLNFLKDFVTVRKTINTLPNSGDKNSLVELNEKAGSLNRKNLFDESSQSEYQDTRRCKRIKTPDPELDEALKSATEFLSKLQNPLKPKNDYEQSATNLFSMHLREITNKDLRDEVVGKIMTLLN